jgi:hypothetical protein
VIGAGWPTRRRALSLLLPVLAGAVLACERGNPRNPGRWVRDGDVVLRDTRPLGAIDSPGLMEGSGVVPSVNTPGLLWALNDSGNDPVLFALTPAGQVRGLVAVRDAINRDWEALSAGPCPQGHCLFIADVGDNDAKRDDLRIYYLREPIAGTASQTVAPDGVIALRFADGPHDVEAIYVAPDASIWLITKRPSRDAGGRQRPSRLYRVPAADWQGSPAVTAVAQVADSIPIVATTGTTREWITDAHLSGADSTGARRLAVLTYGAVYVFAADATTGRPGALVARCALPIRETSAEGLTWLPDGRLLIMNEGRGAKLYGGRCP